jgi:hypothetical protein
LKGSTKLGKKGEREKSLEVRSEIRKKGEGRKVKGER